MGNKEKRLLSDELAYMFGVNFINAETTPEVIKNNLNPNFPLREYQEDAFKYFLTYINSDFPSKEYPSHLLFNMATGSGKTLIMAGCILELYKQGYRNFLFFSTSNPIIEKTKDNFLQNLSSKYLFNQSINIDNKPIRIKEVENFDESNLDDINIKFTTIHKLHNDLSEDKENSLTLESFKNIDTILIGDEAHHFNAKTNSKKEKYSDDKNWESTISDILKSNSKNMLLEYTATIEWSKKEIADKYLSKCIKKYDLKEFRNDGYSKEIKLFQSDKGIEQNDLILQSIILNQFKQDIATDNSINLKPVMLFKAQKTIDQSKENFNNFVKLIKNLSEEDILRIKKYTIKSELIEYDENGYLADKNYLVQAFEYYDNIQDGYSILVKKLKQNFAKNKCINVNQYVFEGSKQSTKKFEKEASSTLSQENLLNTLEHPNNEIRVIFAVNKLNEGWDVLNLFDIVRLYDTRDADNGKAGKTTVAEAQLIGRGARYCPFTTESKDKYKRKYDNDLKNPLRLLETLHYHTVYNSRYISELRAELIKTGAMDDEKVVKEFNLKPAFKKTDLYKKGVVFINDVKDTNYSEYKVWNELSMVKGQEFKYSIYSGRTKESNVLDKEKVKSDITTLTPKQYKIKQLDNMIKKSALLSNNFYNFNNLKKYLKDINTIDDFISNYLDNLSIVVKCKEEDELTNLSRKNQYGLMVVLLAEIQKELSIKITPRQGTKKFREVSLKDLFKDKKLAFDSSNPKLRGDNISFAMLNEWYAYSSNYGTSEEKAFLSSFASFFNDLKEKYSEINVIRNERDLCLFDFAEGRRFEPDFVLFLKDKEKESLNYQVFIEPKGSHLEDKDRWKEDFLKEIKEMFKDESDFLEYHSDDYKIIGLPFYNAKNEALFRQEFEEELL